MFQPDELTDENNIRERTYMKRNIGTIAVALGLAIGSSTAFAAANMEKVKINELPQAVQTTINQHLEGGKLKKIERVTDNGQMFYEVSLKNNGQKEEFRVNADGQYLGPQTGRQNQSMPNTPARPGSGY
ncbi:MAG TPA: hypothetical protein VE344_07770 [Methylomirabilota bacterium]|nr:hypothetical protein [Methylomirabilota bacterium]